jgi:hypothetical protein
MGHRAFPIFLILYIGAVCGLFGFVLAALYGSLLGALP